MEVATTSSQLTGSDEREKKEKKDLQQQAQIGGVCTADEGLLALTVCMETKVKHGKQLFPHCCIVPPLATTWPLLMQTTDSV